jgi:hypothetical protein
VIVHPKLPQKSPFKMFFKSLKGLLCLKLRIADLYCFGLTIWSGWVKITQVNSKFVYG